MLSNTPGKPVNLAFSLLREDGTLLVPTGLRYRVADENETELMPWTAIDLPTEVGYESAVVPVIGGLNMLTPPATRGVRVVELEITTAEGTTVKSESYMLEGPTALTFGINSFLTWAQACMNAADFVPLQLTGWHAADRPTQEKALIEAHGRIIRLPVSIMRDNDQAVDGEFQAIYGPVMLPDLTATQVGQLESRLLQALKLAQLVEADEILMDDPVKAARRAGIVSMSTGESSQFFGTTKALDLGASPRALRYLERWLRFGATLGRR